MVMNSEGSIIQFLILSIHHLIGLISCLSLPPTFSKQHTSTYRLVAKMSHPLSNLITLLFLHIPPLVFFTNKRLKQGTLYRSLLVDVRKEIPIRAVGCW